MDRNELKEGTSICLLCGRTVHYTYYESNRCELGGEYMSYTVTKTDAHQLDGYLEWDDTLAGIKLKIPHHNCNHAAQFVCDSCYARKEWKKLLSFIYWREFFPVKRNVDALEKAIYNIRLERKKRIKHLEAEILKTHTAKEEMITAMQNVFAQFQKVKKK